MGKRGPKPKPTALRVYQGLRVSNPAERALEPQYASTKRVPRPPSWLCAIGKREWRAVATDLHAAGCLTGVDHSFLAQYCQAFANFCQARDHIAETGVYMMSAKASRTSLR